MVLRRAEHHLFPEDRANREFCSPVHPQRLESAAMAHDLAVSDAVPRGYLDATRAASAEFSLKLQQYGPSWLLLRPASITDQALIKAFRLRKLWTDGAENLVGEPPANDLRALINYAFMAIQIVRANPEGRWPDLTVSLAQLEQQTARVRGEAIELLIRKNHDYDNAWKQFRPGTFVDLVLTKLYRIRTLESDLVSAAVQDKVCQEWFDIANYCALVTEQCPK